MPILIPQQDGLDHFLPDYTSLLGSSLDGEYRLAVRQNPISDVVRIQYLDDPGFGNGHSFRNRAYGVTSNIVSVMLPPALLDADAEYSQSFTTESTGGAISRLAGVVPSNRPDLMLGRPTAPTAD